MKHYSYRNIDKTGAIYRLIIGERTNGKTYGFCIHVLKGFMENGKPSAYIRRFDTEFKLPNTKRLFNSMILDTGDFKKITKGKWTDVIFQGGIYWIRHFDDKGKCDCKKELLYGYSLNTWMNAKGGDIGPVNYTAYDEFCTRGKYLDDEFQAYQQTLSTIIRNRKGVINYLIANTVNKYCPLFEEFGIDIDEVKQGTIVNYQNGIAIEYCENTGNNSKSEYLIPFKNVQLEFLKTGAWETAQYPKLNKFATFDSVEYRFYINFNHKTVCGEIRQTPAGGLYIFYYYQTKPIPKKIADNAITFNQIPNTNPLSSTSIQKYQPTKIHKLIYELIKANKQFYQSNDVGEYIRNWLLWQGVVAK